MNQLDATELYTLKGLKFFKKMVEILGCVYLTTGEKKFVIAV